MPSLFVSLATITCHQSMPGDPLPAIDDISLLTHRRIREHHVWQSHRVLLASVVKRSSAQGWLFLIFSLVLVSWFSFQSLRWNTRFNDVMNHVNHADFIEMPSTSSLEFGPVFFWTVWGFNLDFAFFHIVGANLHTYILTQWNWIAKITVELDAGYAVCKPFWYLAPEVESINGYLLAFDMKASFLICSTPWGEKKTPNHGAFHHRTNVPYHCCKLRLSCHYIGRHPQVLRAQGWDVATRDRPRCRDL